MKDLSIIILSYNTSETTRNCIELLIENLKKTSLKFEIIVIDNNSIDNSPLMLKQIQKENDDIVKIFLLNHNLGFTKANNFGASKAQGTNILFLNSDVYIQNVDFNELVNSLNSNSKVGALTVKLLLDSKKIDMACHRGEPSLWNSFCYFAKLETLSNYFTFLKPFFGGYHLTYLNLSKQHYVDAISGAFFLITKKLFNSLKGFDEVFFMYAEDLDLSKRIRDLNLKILFIPQYTAKHLKYMSGKKSQGQGLKIANYNFVKSMYLYYKKHEEKKQNFVVSFLMTLFFNVIIFRYEKNRN